MHASGTYSCKSSLVPQFFDKTRNSVSDDVSILFVATGTLLANVWDDPGDLLSLLWVACFEMYRGCQTETAGDAMWNAVCSAYGMTDAVTQADSAGIEEGEER